MNKIKLNKAEEKACRSVVAFWMKLEKRLLSKEKRKDGFWVKNNGRVAPNHCPLCTVAEKHGWDEDYRYCSHCVYYRVYGYECFDRKRGHLEKFERNPNLRTCRGCIRAAQRILDGAK